MNTRLCVVCAAMAFAATLSCKAGASKEPVAANDRPVECPDGHKELRDVPIRYGLVSYDEQLKRDLADMKYVLGGCCVGIDSPKTAVICGNCRFRYQGDGVWHKSSRDVDVFGKPFSPVLQDFVNLLKPEGVVHYDQTVKGTQMISQRVQYKCTIDRNRLDLEVALLMRRHGIRRDQSRYDHEVFYGSNAKASVYQVWVLTDQGNQLLDLSISSKRSKVTAEELKHSGEQTDERQPE